MIKSYIRYASNKQASRVEKLAFLTVIYTTRNETSYHATIYKTRAKTRAQRGSLVIPINSLKHRSTSTYVDTDEKHLCFHERVYDHRPKASKVNDHHHKYKSLCIDSR